MTAQTNAVKMPTNMIDIWSASARMTARMPPKTV